MSRLFILLLFFINIAYAKQTHTVLDMYGNEVVLNKDIKRVVSVGAIPVLNSFVFALNRGGTIRNELPKNFKARAMSAKLHEVLAKNSNISFVSSPDIENLIRHKIDLVLTMDSFMTQNFLKKGINSISLRWQNQDDLKKLMLLLGDVLNAQNEALVYNDYLSQKLEFIESRVKTIPEQNRVKVLYMNFTTLTNPHIIADWWIEKVGAKSVTDINRQVEQESFSAEKLLFWDPDIIVVSSKKDKDDIYADKRYSALKAVIYKNIYVAPSGIHLWANRTSELPLMLLWASKKIYPEYFSDVDVAKETREFYKNFFTYQLSDEELEGILNGG
ncbi:MAG: ABC transporter substrate-binding protein [Sulfurimonadaceae bacterium]|nr:ABC transporter substrate-binding protein [Sulfurimonadaceae bacterium]